MKKKKSPVLRRDKISLFLYSDPGRVYLHTLHYVHYTCQWHVCDMPIEAEPFSHGVKQLLLETMISVWQSGEFTCKLQVNSIEMEFWEVWNRMEPAVSSFSVQ